MNSLKRIGVWSLALAIGFCDLGQTLESGGLPTLAPPAQARIGHPLTPLSYAGVARRTARRVVRRTAYRLNALPVGCVYGVYSGGNYYYCAGVYYQASGGVYVQVVFD
jgi:hypothetical protein